MEGNLRAWPMLLAALCLAGCASAPAPNAAGPYIERISPEDLARILPAPQARLSLADLVRLSKEGATAQAIIAKIRETGSRYELSASQAIELHTQGVDKAVLDYIQSAREQDLRDRVADEINQRELRHAEQLRREQELRRNSYYNDPWLWGVPGNYGWGWSYGFPARPHGWLYWRR